MQKLILSVTAIILAGCASSNAPTSSERIAEQLKDVRVGGQVDKICFSSTIDGFRNNTRNSVVLTRGVSDDYLVVVRSCQMMDHARSIGLVGRGSCLRRSDQLLISDSAFSLSGDTTRGPDRCWVEAIYEWDKDAVADDPSEVNEK